MDFHIGPVIRAQGHGSVEHKFHVAGTAGFLGGQGYLFRDIAGRNQLFSQAHIVVIYHDHIQPWLYVRVAVNDLTEAEYHMDDILCNGICRRCLGSKDGGDGSGRPAAPFDFQVFVYQVQGVHLLALVFMKTFYLYVKNGFGVNVNVLGFLKVVCQLLFLTVLDG